jgi:hypothetical protein
MILQHTSAVQLLQQLGPNSIQSAFLCFLYCGIVPSFIAASCRLALIHPDLGRQRSSRRSLNGEKQIFIDLNKVLHLLLYSRINSESSGIVHVRATDLQRPKQGPDLLSYSRINSGSSVILIYCCASLPLIRALRRLRRHCRLIRALRRLRLIRAYASNPSAQI